MGDKKKLKLVIWIAIILAIAGFVVVLFFAPHEGKNGLIFDTLKSVIFVVLAAVIITSVIKHKSVTKTDKISKYIAIGVVLYALIAVIAGYIGYQTFTDLNGKRSNLTLDVANYDTYRTDYGKLGSLYHLNITTEGKQISFYIQEETYKAIKEVRQIEVEYYTNNKVIYSVKCNDAVAATTNNIANFVSDVADNAKTTVSNLADTATETVTDVFSGITNNSSVTEGNDNTANDIFTE